MSPLDKKVKVGFNINDVMYVKLTDYGRQLMASDRYPVTKVPDKDGYTKWQMWELMQHFGPQCGLGQTLPFETTILVQHCEADITIGLLTS